LKYVVDIKQGCNGNKRYKLEELVTTLTPIWDQCAGPSAPLRRLLDPGVNAMSSIEGIKPDLSVTSGHFG